MNTARRNVRAIFGIGVMLLGSFLLLGGSLPALAQGEELPPLPPLQTVASNPQFDIDAILQRTPVEASAAEVREAAAEIRRQSVRFGLSPIDRRRLQWAMPKAPEASAVR